MPDTTVVDKSHSTKYETEISQKMQYFINLFSLFLFMPGFTDFLIKIS